MDRHSYTSRTEGDFDVTNIVYPESKGTLLKRRHGTDAERLMCGHV